MEPGTGWLFQLCFNQEIFTWTLGLGDTKAPSEAQTWKKCLELPEVLL